MDVWDVAVAVASQAPLVAVAVVVLYLLLSREIRNEVRRVERRIDKLEERVVRLEERTSKIEEQMGRVENDVAELKGRVGRLEEQLGRLLHSQVQQDLLIANAYFVPGVRFTRLLCRAARRGVAIQILVPGHSDSGFVQAAGRASYGKLLASGVRIFERQGRMLHSKAGVFDDGLALIGSGNMDPRSFRLNLELNLAIHHWGVAADLRCIFENYRTESVEIQDQTWARRPWWRRAYEWLAYQFRWLL